MKSPFLAVCIAALLTLAPFGRRAEATVEVWEIVNVDSRLFINFSSNHGYYSRDLPIRYRHAVSALGAVRHTLIREGKLRDLPIVFVIPDSGFSTASGKIEAERLASHSLVRGDAEQVPIGPCYKIHIPASTAQGLSYNDLLTLTLVLQDLAPAKSRIAVGDLRKLKATSTRAIAHHAGIMEHHDPIWSPDGKLLLYTVFKDGDVHLEVLDTVHGSVRKLNGLKGYPVVRPVWSPDSRHIAYASLNQIQIFDTRTDQTRTIAPVISGEAAHYETLIKFQSPIRLLFAGDTNLFDSYHIYAFNLSGKITPLERGAGRPGWAPDAATEERALARTRATSPDGKRTAEVVREGGVSRILIRSAGKTVRVAALQARAVPPAVTVVTAPAQAEPQETIPPATSESPDKTSNVATRSVEDTGDVPQTSGAARQWGVVGAIVLAGVCLGLFLWSRKRARR